MTANKIEVAIIGAGIGGLATALSHILHLTV